MHQLPNNVWTASGWEIIETRFDPDQLVTTGSNYMIGNGYLGYRGTPAEWEADRYTACIVTDTWDTAPGGRWRELCNVPNPLFLPVWVNDAPLSLFAGETVDYRRALDLRHALFSRAQTWRADTDSPAVRLETEKFASLADVRTLAQRTILTAHAAARIRVRAGLDGRVWSLNGNHFARLTPRPAGAILALEAETHEFGTIIVSASGLKFQGPEPVETRLIEEEARLLRELAWDLAAGESVTLIMVASVTHSNDFDSPDETPHDAAITRVSDGLARSYAALRADHSAAWDAVWEASDIVITGNIEAQLLTRFNLYHNTIATPVHAPLPIGARGLSCQVYQGAAFWDQEIFNLPMFTYVRPDVARRILEYRYHTLGGARQKARRLGYYGAFYAWTSGKTGEELFPDIFFTDVLTGRPIRNHFNCWQIHISPDIVYALWQYVDATGDWDFVLDYGAEIAFEVAQFLVARVHFKMDKGRYEFIRLLGPDEYHENVDNDAFTNYQARHALQVALAIYDRLRAEHPDRLRALFERLELDEDDVNAWHDIVARIYLPQPDDTGLIEQFDGYFDLEDITPDRLRERLQHPEEYWGWPNGIAVRTQVLKQADVLQLLALHDGAHGFDRAVLRANFDYYEPRTEHGSSLSPAVHALVAARAGYAEAAYDYFRTAATIDLYNASTKVMSGGTFLGGIHTAAAGGVWQVIVQGFAGFKAEGDGLRLDPALPAGWESLSFRVVVQGRAVRVTLTHVEAHLEAESANPAPLTVHLGAEAVELGPGEAATLAV